MILVLERHPHSATNTKLIPSPPLGSPPPLVAALKHHRACPPLREGLEISPRRGIFIHEPAGGSPGRLWEAALCFPCRLRDKYGTVRRVSLLGVRTANNKQGWVAGRLLWPSPAPLQPVPLQAGCVTGQL